MPPVDVIHLHHGVLAERVGHARRPSPIGSVQPIFFGGEEKTVFRIPKGYGSPTRRPTLDPQRDDPQQHAERREGPAGVGPRLHPDVRAGRQTVTPVIPLWMDVRRGWAIRLRRRPGHGGSDGQLDAPRPRSPRTPTPTAIARTSSDAYDATIVGAVGHLHPGGLRDDIDVARPASTASKLIFRSTGQ